MVWRELTSQEQGIFSVNTESQKLWFVPGCPHEDQVCNLQINDEIVSNAPLMKNLEVDICNSCYHPSFPSFLRRLSCLFCSD